MGDTYYLKLNCAYCGKENPKPREPKEGENPLYVEFIIYNPEWGDEFTCDYCGKKNKISFKMSAYKTKEA